MKNIYVLLLLFLRTWPLRTVVLVALLISRTSLPTFSPVLPTGAYFVDPVRFLILMDATEIIKNNAKLFIPMKPNRSKSWQSLTLSKAYG